MRAIILAAAALALAGCKSTPENGFAVDVTVSADSSLSSSSRSDVRTLDVSVSGAETFHTTYPITSQLASGNAKFIYRPSVSSGSLIFAIYALDDSGASLAFGQATATLKSGATTTLTVTLGTGSVPSTDMAMCPTACPTLGATQCMGTQVQTCQLIDGCQTWGPAADCGSNMLCCADACVAADVSNCYACGAACSGNTPVCLATPMKCGCSVAVCATGSMGCDTSTGGCVACTALPANSADFYVDATSFTGGTGTAVCPFKTITAALTAANASTAATKTIHVAGGTYDAALGETFPLQLRKVSLVGAGMLKTVIRGIGAFDHTTLGGQFSGSINATILVGDVAVASTISDLQVRAPVDAVTGGYYGVFCDQGNAPNMTGPPPTPFPSPNLDLQALSIGPGFEWGTILTTSNGVAGCNARIRNSNYDSGGIWGLGCGLNPPGATPTYVAAQVGDTVGGGNTFVNIKNSGNNASSITLWDCSSPDYIQGNTFDGDDIAVVIAKHVQTDVVTVENDTFKNLTNFGIDMSPLGGLDRLIGNTFTNISAPSSVGYRGVALIIGESNTTGANRPQIKKARTNSFIGNDVAIEWRGSAVFSNDTALTDFGTPTDAGKNVFRCNSTGTGSALVGYDLLIAQQATAGQAVPSFAGNQWDHSSPTTATAASAANGTDVLYTQTTNTPAFDLSGATVSTAACPTGRTP